MTSEAASHSPLREANGTEITVLMDNYTDILLAGSDRVQRVPLSRGERLADPLLAEHGLSLLVKARRAQEEHPVLLDAGWSKIGVPFNLKALDIDPGRFAALVLSHGHPDHFGAMEGVLQMASPQRLPLVVHPDAFLTRYLKLPDGRKVHFEPLKEQPLREAGAELRIAQGPSSLASQLLLSTGEVERTTDFEKGLPNAYAVRGGQDAPDPIRDDQGLVVHLQDRGLVVISGCAHAGIINTVRYAQKITGVGKVYAIIGGFHLSGPQFEPWIERTVQELKEISPQLIVPMHCTGWKAIVRIAAELPEAFALSSVGSRICL